MSEPFNLESLRLETSPVVVPILRTARPKLAKGEKFIAGPFPLKWFQIACEIKGGGAIKVAMAIWYLAGLQKSRTVKLTSVSRKLFSVPPKTFDRAMEALASRGLVSVVTRRGASPMVTILDVPTAHFKIAECPASCDETG